MASQNDSKYQDAWQTYRSITQKLKKRFLRKPNLSEASREFQNLAKRLEEDEQCLEYAALCHLSSARCEQQNGSALGEQNGLKRAARFFMKAEMEQFDMGFPGYHENLQSAMHCYQHTMRTHLEAKQPLMAGCVCMELATHLKNLDRHADAAEYFEKASIYLTSELHSKAAALWSLIDCCLHCDWNHKAQTTIEQLEKALCEDSTNWQTAQSTSQSLIGWQSNMLRELEVVELLLLLHCRTLPAQMSERSSALYSKYSCMQAVDQPILAQNTTKHTTDADYLLLQSFTLSVQWREAESADLAFTQLLPGLRPVHCLLGIAIVEALYTEEYDPY